ncbi:alpha/beta fold hydrolase [Ascidiimonas sp. W6]|uniref:alpha/beta fold hydrolase n=1 Tax=Ascidiimonas meishanensis TaxID=3128903 RepID=UPI0030EE4D20
MSLLHSKIIGKGKPLIILHGFLGMSDNWKTLGNFYAESGFEVHLVDQRNHGRSFHAESFSYELMSADLLYYLQYHKIERSQIIGHSMGGKTAMFFALHNPENVHKLIIADIAPKYYSVHHQEILEGLHSVNLNEISSRKEAEEQLGLYIKDFGIRQFLLKNLYRKTRDSFDWRMNLPVLSAHVEEVGASTPEDKEFKGETLFLKGGKSNYLTMDDIPLITKLFPNTTIESIENAGHWLHAENPKQFIEFSMNFLDPS